MIGMLKYWLNRLAGKPTVRVLGPGRALLYRDGGRVIEVPVRFTKDSWMVDVGGIVSWNDRPDRILGAAERKKVAEAVRDVVKSQWGKSVGFAE